MWAIADAAGPEAHALLCGGRAAAALRATLARFPSESSVHVSAAEALYELEARDV